MPCGSKSAMPPLMHVNMHCRAVESRQVKNKAVYVALGVTPEGEREVLGLWIAANAPLGHFANALPGRAKFWLSIMNNPKNRGLEDILVAVVPSHGLQANHCRVTDGLTNRSRRLPTP